ncbi:unnamed protein product [Phytophthora lilii]|uniref:Unnamed protein product n=1 Tax=Phytophthora lilii TaxID=2077276 RepID=A0A9W6XAB5_9STRA|nr:unnamed protein product [Phytophthora lilii]
MIPSVLPGDTLRDSDDVLHGTPLPWYSTTMVLHYHGTPLPCNTSSLSLRVSPWGMVLHYHVVHHCGVETQLGVDLSVAAAVPNGDKLPEYGLKDSLVIDWLIFTGSDVSESAHRVT